MKYISSLASLFIVGTFILSSLNLYISELPSKDSLSVMTGKLSELRNCSNPIKGMSRQHFTIVTNDEPRSFHVFCKAHNTPIISANELNKPTTVLYHNKRGYFFIPEAHVYHLVSNGQTLVNYSNFVRTENSATIFDIFITIVATLYLAYLARRLIARRPGGTRKNRLAP